MMSTNPSPKNWRAPATHFDAFGTPRRGLKREEAARYIGVSPTKFDELVRDGRMPQPKRFDGCVRWDIRRLDVAWDALGSAGDDVNEWDITL